ncbi:hypothetical protein NQ314_018179 [Rhamnusium bicolor]|uniref:RING-type domain-containing protein n=1 Tax=Rhamnusium bicolor TaxID=1586634 RepID=A0AAV8WQW3_9CUCU|nr:hypothetical protein NQ314_018179 [Rhamnusium bicolor]
MAASSFDLPEPEVDTLKCSICDNYLSMSPILIVSADGPDQVCGRCKDIPKFKLIRNIAFEKLAKFVKFPCIYEICPEKIAWGEARRHELICSQRNMRCPMYYVGCKATVRIPELHYHIQGHCELKHHKYSKIYGKGADMFKNMTSRIPSQPVIDLVESDMFTYTLSVSDKEEIPAEGIVETSDKSTTEEILQGTNGKASSDEASNNLVRECLKCPVCNKYMLAPIFSCNIGHVICNKCTSKLKYCPTCKIRIEETRNLPLEAIAENIEFRCSNVKDNCDFFGNIKMICEHEAMCLAPFL